MFVFSTLDEFCMHKVLVEDVDNKWLLIMINEFILFAYRCFKMCLLCLVKRPLIIKGKTHAKKLWNLIQFSICLYMLCGLRDNNNLIATLVIVTFYELLACVNEL